MVRLLNSFLPCAVLTDSYKATHYLQYPDSKKFVAVSPLSALASVLQCAAATVPLHAAVGGPMTSDPVLNPSKPVLLQYGEFRRGFEGDKADTRLVWYGIRYVVESYVARQWTEEEVEQAALFYR